MNDSPRQHCEKIAEISFFVSAGKVFYKQIQMPVEK